jgi:hypothetical protein
MGKEVGVPVIVRPKIIADPNRNLSEFVGQYKMGPGSETDVMVRNGYLYASDIKLYPTRTDCFFEYKFFGDVCFLREAGKITAIQWKGSNFDLKWIKQ